MGNIDLELAAIKSIQRTRKISLDDLGFRIKKDDEIKLSDVDYKDYDDSESTFDFIDLDEYEKLNFFVQEEFEDTQQDFDYIIAKYKDQPLYLCVYFLQVYNKISRSKLIKIAQVLYDYFHKEYNLIIDDFETDLVTTMYILIRYSSLIIEIISIIVANTIVKNYDKFDERKYTEGLSYFINDFFDATNDLNLSKKLTLAFIYYTDNVDRCNFSLKSLDKLLSVFTKNIVKHSLYNLFKNNTLKTLLNTCLFIQDASINDFKIEVVVHTVEFIKRRIESQS